MSNQKKPYRKLNHYNLRQSFSFAVSGLWFALRWERNLRIHLNIAAYIAYFSTMYYNFTKGEIGLIVLTMSTVITSELFNTAIEKTIDTKTPDFNPLAKIAKDVAAGAVLVSSIGSLVIGLVLFGDLDILSVILSDVVSRLYIWIPLVILSLSIIFVPEINGNHHE